MTDEKQATGEAVLSSDGLERISFDEQKERTAEDIDSIVASLQKLSTDVRAGDMQAFEHWWIEGGTEEGDATVFKLRELLILRYSYRDELLRSNPK